MPLKFGTETVTSVICARVCLTVEGEGKRAEGWGETPLSVQWVWPSVLDYGERLRRLQDFCVTLAGAWAGYGVAGHPIEIGWSFQEEVLRGALKESNAGAARPEHAMPWLAALVCCAPFDLALHDAFGNLVGRPVYETYSAEFMTRDLSHYLQPVSLDVSFNQLFPADFLRRTRDTGLVAWHLVGGLDPLRVEDLTSAAPDDGHPVLLEDWIRQDELKCLKIKLRGSDAAWDLERLVQVGEIAERRGVDWLSADFNCTVTDPEYVNGILDRLRDEWPRLYGMLLYVEQPFPYELEEHPVDVRSVSARKPLFLDESAHDWRMVRFGRSLGWSGVALKTCKTQTGALLAACWARAHGMTLMVQDLTNPMLAQIPHLLLAAEVGTIMGVETNSMQFYPDASAPEAAVHPGVYRRRRGRVDLGSIQGPGFGYRLGGIKRELPAPAAEF